MRRRIAVEAARLIAEQGLRDYHAAKLKAASYFGQPDSLPLPRNAEIEEALREHQRLFQAGSQPLRLARLRDAALEAMRFLARFEPRLVGPVLEGTADEYSAVCLHLFTDDPDELAMFLRANGIPFDQQERRLRLDADHTGDYPALLFSAGGTPIDLTVFPLDGLRQAPLDRISERPMRRASVDALRELQRGQERS
ncbi:MAG TPA: hypothetical protein PKC03_16075 [Dokdonella sp.]|nr:hypothetical protein [Dokdonella sp.]